jgi:hypothetical protein
MIKIFSIATGNYKSFLDKFLQSFNVFFETRLDKEFHIFTDEIPSSEEFYNVNYHYIEHEKWPLITLNRYNYINSLKDQIKSDDLCIFADIDLEVVSWVNDFSVEKLFGVSHPGNYYIDNIESLETNIKSRACINKQDIPKNYQYIQGCLWGGKGDYFLNLITELYSNTKIDYENNIVARWHDESHLNKYYINNFELFNILSSSYAYPENWTLPVEKLIIHKDKNMLEYPRFQGCS